MNSNNLKLKKLLHAVTNIMKEVKLWTFLSLEKLHSQFDYMSPASMENWADISDPQVPPKKQKDQ